MGVHRPSAYNVLLAPGVERRPAVGEIEGALGPYSGLAVQTAQTHASEQSALSRQGLQRLSRSRR